MACTYTFLPLCCRPIFISACVKLLKDQWPYCKSHLLLTVAHRENSVPCSLAMVEHPVGWQRRASFVGHIRAVPVTNRAHAVFLEAMCIERNKQGMNLGRKVMASAEDYVRHLGYREVYFTAKPHLTDYYLSQSYVVHQPPSQAVHTVGANLLRANQVTDWHGNAPYPGLESEYEDGPIATEEEVANEKVGRWFVKYLNGSIAQGTG